MDRLMRESRAYVSIRSPMKITARRGSPPAESVTTSSNSSSDRSTHKDSTTESSFTGGPPREVYGYFNGLQMYFALVLNLDSCM